MSESVPDPVARPLDKPSLGELARLLRARDDIDHEIATLLGRPPTAGTIGEVVAAAIFDLELAPTGVNAGFDGQFRSGPLAGSTVNVKAYAEQTTLLDISPHPCDWYLVLMGPARSRPHRGRSLPFLIERIFLFEIAALRAKLTAAGISIGVATSVRKLEWEAAQIYPVPASSAALIPTDEQRHLL